jgi:hypothetical protein
MASAAAIAPPQPGPGPSTTYDAAPGPIGSLFQRHGTTTKKKLHDLIGAMGSIERTFGSNDNASGLLATGGSGLAAYASFDPNYSRAKQWITNHPVGNSVLSPIFLTGLTGALTEAAFPQAVITSQSIRQQLPLIVGVPVRATIEVMHVTKEATTNANNNGFHIHLKTKVTRVRDDAMIAEGTHDLWVPDYQNM